MIFSIWLMDGDFSDNMGCIKVFQLSSSTLSILFDLFQKIKYKLMMMSKVL